MLNPDFKEIISAFNGADVEYLIVGAYAVAAHGLPRTTGEIDERFERIAGETERRWAPCNAQARRTLYGCHIAGDRRGVWRLDRLGEIDRR